jgi:hypothetical protein
MSETMDLTSRAIKSAMEDIGVRNSVALKKLQQLLDCFAGKLSVDDVGKTCVTTSILLTFTTTLSLDNAEQAQFEEFMLDTAQNIVQWNKATGDDKLTVKAESTAELVSLAHQLENSYTVGSAAACIAERMLEVL